MYKSPQGIHFSWFFVFFVAIIHHKCRFTACLNPFSTTKCTKFHEKGNDFAKNDSANIFQLLKARNCAKKTFFPSFPRYSAHFSAFFVFYVVNENQQSHFCGNVASQSPFYGLF
jgi:hypothetical protein